MQLFLQLTLSGLTNGAIYALVALGFVLIYKSTDVINFAQGEFLLIGAYVAYMTLGQWGLPWPIGVVVTLAIGVIVAVEVLSRDVDAAGEARRQGIERQEGRRPGHRTNW